MFFIKESEIFKKNENEYFLVNLTNAALDIIDSDLATKIKNERYDLIDQSIINALQERKYLFKSERDYNDYIFSLNNKIKQAEKNAYPNFLLIPSYNCNLNCIYCYEHTYEMSCKNKERDLALIDLQFKLIDAIVKEGAISRENLDKVRITIMGGEPLLIPNKDVIEKIIKKADEKGYSIDIVTNGVDLDSFIKIIKNDTVKNIQITLDGPKEIHDQRRIFYNGAGSFDKIMKNLKLAIENNIEVYIRVNVDNSNIDSLPKLADLFYSEFGDCKNLHPYIYLLQDGGCSGESNVVKENVGLEKIYKLQKENVNLNRFYIKSHIYPLIKSILYNEPFNPRLKHCGASGNQFILDEKLLVYKCWHGIGNETFSVGKYDENGFKLNEKLVRNWIDRDASILPKCVDCKYRYICGTGCPAATHKKSNLMNTKLPFCSDYKKLLEISLLNYFGS